jgi:glycosyltransferase involved in cell wall biosynthesis
LNQQKKVIALVANTSWSIYNFRLGLIRHLKNQGIEIVVIAPKDAFTAKLVAEGIEFYEIEISNYGTNPVVELGLIRNLVRLYKEINPQLIFHYTIKPNIYGTLAAKYCGIPSVIITTGLGHLFEFKNRIVSTITLFLYRISCTFSKKTLFLNSNDLDVFVYKKVVKKSKAILLRGEGIDLDWFSLKKVQKHPRKTIFLFAGRLLIDKGVNEYVEAAQKIRAQYKDVEFQILGFVDQSNPNSIAYQQIIEWQHKKIISYLGETSDVRPYLANCDCLVFPSYYREGVSRILMEASAMECPIITTDNVGCREVVDDGINGFLVIPKDVSSLVEAIGKFLNLCIEDRQLMGKLGRSKMNREFDQEIVFRQYDEIISSLLEIKQGKKQQTLQNN